MVLLVFCSGCQDFWGKKTDLGFIEVPNYGDDVVAYVPIQPSLLGFADPSDVLAGYDELLYVADAGVGQIIQYDQAGRELSRFNLPKVRAIAQDRKLNLLAIADFDTIITGNAVTLNAIYRIALSQNPHSLNGAKIIKRVIHPFYFKSIVSQSDLSVTFRDITVLADNSYYVTRNGISNSTLQFGGPDDAVVLMDANDIFMGILSVKTIQGTFNNYFRQPLAMAGYAQPPQSPYVSTSRDFFISSGDRFISLNVQNIRVTNGLDGLEYSLNTDLGAMDTSKADGFLYTPQRFGLATGMTLAGDGTNYLFVADSQKDSLFIFTNTGLEGVSPPPGSNNKKNIRVSFGGAGAGPLQFSRPTAVAYLNKVVFVCDRGNKRISRFKLTTDFN